jgi:RimJ/RimL family protein N-acetyltransferase
MIDTKRLSLKPLNYEQLLAYTQDKAALDALLGLNATSGYISSDLKEAIEKTMLPALADEKINYLYATLWVVIWKKENKIIGGVSFTGAQDEKGAIEIGYGCDEEFRGMGFMKEAVRGMLEWAKKQPKVYCVKACTHNENIASGKILKHNDFLKINDSGEMSFWKYELKRYACNEGGMVL